MTDGTGTLVSFCASGVSESRCKSGGGEVFDADYCTRNSNGGVNLAAFPYKCTGVAATSIARGNETSTLFANNHVETVLLPVLGTLNEQVGTVDCGLVEDSVCTISEYKGAQTQYNGSCICMRQAFPDFPCTSDAQCSSVTAFPRSTKCDASSGVCVLVSFGACQQDHVCSETTGECIVGTRLPEACGVESGDPCPGNTVCIGGNCFATLSECSGRTGDKPCPVGTRGAWCDPGTGCVSGCQIDGDCPSSLSKCVNTMCVTDECTIDVDCGPGYRCTNRAQCVQECASDAECGDGARCQTSGDLKYCGVPCEFSSDCGERQFCDRGEQGKDPGVCSRGCKTAADCAPGYGCWVDGSCRVACTSDTDCGTTQTCNQGACVFSPSGSGSSARYWIIGVVAGAVVVILLLAVLVRAMHRKSAIAAANRLALQRETGPN